MAHLLYRRASFHPCKKENESVVFHPFFSFLPLFIHQQYICARMGDIALLINLQRFKTPSHLNIMKYLYYSEVQFLTFAQELSKCYFSDSISCRNVLEWFIVFHSYIVVVWWVRCTSCLCITMIMICYVHPEE